MKFAFSICVDLLWASYAFMPPLNAASLDGNNAAPAPTQNQSSTTPPSAAKATTAPTPDEKAPAPSSFWDQDTLTGDSDGLRKQLEDEGFKVTPTYTALILGNPSGGVKQGVVTDGLINVELDFDLEKMTAGDVDGLLILSAFFPNAFVQGSQGRHLL